MAARGDVIHVCEALGGGVLRVIQALADATAERGIETVVVHGRRPETPASVADAFDARVRIVEVNGWGNRSPNGAVATARAARTVNSELGRRRRGVLHLHSTFAGIVGRALPSRGHELFYTPHAYAFLNPSTPSVVRFAMHAMEHALAHRGMTIACSETEADVAATLVAPGRVIVARNGVDLETLPAPRPEPTECFLIGCVGRAVYQRRPDAVAALARSARASLDARFVWFGDGPFREPLTAAGVDVRGWLGEVESARAYGDTNVVLHLSAFEGLPIALLEAMAAERPIVASDLPAIREVVGDVALLVASEDEALEALRTLRHDAQLRRRLGLLGRERVADHFTRRGMIDRVLAAYSLNRS